MLCEEIKPTFSHHDCIHNQLAAIRNRVVGVVPRPNRAGLAKLRLAAAHMAHEFRVCVPEDYYEMPLRYGGGKRKRYEDATDEVLAFGLEPRDATIKMFVKCEKTLPDDYKPNPDPRAIQFRNPKYCVELGRYLKPIEEQLYLTKVCSRGVRRSRNIAKGLNQVERAHLLISKLNAFDDPVVVSLDASRFDQHVDHELLRLEHAFYLALLPNGHFAWLLNMQIRNFCISSKGIKYKTLGKRMSGDMNTALGNCLLMIIMITAFMDWCQKWDCLDDGDDVLVILERTDLPSMLARARPDFLAFGMEIKVENIAYDVHDVVFCQSKVIEHQPGRFKFTRNPWKVMSCALTGTKYFTQEGARARLLYTIGICELILNLGVPILQEFALAIIRNCGTTGTFGLAPDSAIMIRTRRELRALGLKHIDRVEPQPITNVARLSFAYAFGVSPHQQVAMERWLGEWTFEILGTWELPPEWSVSEWDRFPAAEPECYYP